jgi:predicted nucleic acid-binding protein
MSKAITDSTVLIYLARVGDLALLQTQFSEVIVPEPVYQEVVIRGQVEGYPDAMAIEDTIDSRFIRRSLGDSLEEKAAQIRQTANLGQEEAAAIAIALSTDRSVCLTDDHAARRTAESFGVDIGGTIYVLLQALEYEHISFEQYKSRLDSLDDAGFRMSAALYREALDAGNELS